MKSTADRYREAGMPPPRDHIDPLPERVHDPATDEPVLPDLPAFTYGSVSVPLDPSDANTTEEQS